MTRTARPTLRVIREDLHDGWHNSYARRAIEREDFDAVMPLTSLEHPLLAKAAEAFGEDPKADTPVGPIASVTSRALQEVKAGQWRAGVWVDANDVCWVVVAGLAKGGHQDRDDFYEQIKRLESRGGIERLLPTSGDVDLWKIERGHAILDTWRVQNQQIVTEELARIAAGGTTRFAIPAPVVAVERGRPEVLAEVDLTVERTEEPGDMTEGVVVEVHERYGWKGSQLAFAFTTSLLVMLHPPETDWDVGGGLYSNMLEIGTLERRVGELQEMASAGEQASSEPTRESHYVHQRNLAARTVLGQPARGMCGVYLVPRQDHDRLPVCSICAAAYAEAPR